MRRPTAEESSLAPLHPGLADSCVQAVIAALPRTGMKPGPYIPVGVERLSFSGPSQGPLWAHARLRPQADGAEEFQGDLLLFEESGRVVASWEGIRYRRAPREAFLPASKPDQLLYRLHWREQEAGTPPSQTAGRWLLLGHDAQWLTALAHQLSERGARCSVVTSRGQEVGTLFEKAASQLDGTPTGVLLSFAAGVRQEPDEVTAEALER